MRLALLVLFAVAATAVDPALQIRFDAPAGLQCGTASFTATAAGMEDVHGEWASDAVVDVALDRTAEWRLQTQSERCWTPEVVLQPGGSVVTVPVWPKRLLRGRMVLPRGTGSPAFAEARISSPGVAEGVIRCPIADGRFTCEAPAVPLDVRLSVDGFAPHYLWDVAAEDVGEVHFIQGALVSGTASVATDDSKAGISIELRPATFAWSPDDVKREAAQARRAKTNARGFFSFSSVPPGEYSVIATKEGWSPVEYRVHVAGGATEAAVGKELVLPELARLEIVISPPVDARQHAWRVKLDRRLNGETVPVAHGEVSANGVWQYAGAGAGAYVVTVLDESGSTVSSEGVMVPGGPMTIPLRVQQVVIRGTVTLAGEPVAARLRFNDRRGKVSNLATDEDGRFSGTVASEGKWDIELWPRASETRITLKDVEIRRSEATGYADVDLELPAGRVRGVVVDAEGKPVEGHVSIRRNREHVAAGKTAANGTFDLAGIPEGEMTLHATTPNREESDVIPHRVDEDDDAAVRIVVRRKRQFRGRLVTADGRPVAGARVLHRTTWGAWSELTSGPRGDLSISASPTESHVDLAIAAPGMPLKFARVPIDHARETVDIAYSPAPGLLTIARNTNRWPTLNIGIGNELWDSIATWLARPWEAESSTARLVDGDIQLVVEPAEYTVCTQKRTTCKTVRVAPGARASIDARGWEE